MTRDGMQPLAPTALQVWTVAFSDLLRDALVALSEREQRVFLDIAAGRLANEIARRTDWEEQPS